MGGWRSEGVDPAIFANRLMENCKHFVESEGVVDPLELMKLAYRKLITSSGISRGGCTVCLAAVGPKGRLKVANLGDSGLMVLRDSQCIFHSEEQCWRFNTPFQLSAPEGNQPEDSAEGSVQLQQGDVIVMGSDGLFDNLFPKRIAEIVAHAVAQGATPRQIAEQVKEHAFAASLQNNVVSPFQLAAEKHRIRYQGGKPDDITVVVAVVVPPP